MNPREELLADLLSEGLTETDALDVIAYLNGILPQRPPQLSDFSNGDIATARAAVSHVTLPVITPAWREARNNSAYEDRYYALKAQGYVTPEHHYSRLADRMKYMAVQP